MAADRPRKVVGSYRLVFRRRWRLHRIQGWRIPLPGGLELRAVGYWLASLAAIALLSSLPLLGAPLAALPPSLRLLALPIAAAWALSRWEPDGRSPHRALAGLAAYRLRPRDLSGLRRCPAVGSELPGPELTLAPHLTAPDLPRGRVQGPARLMLRYPAEAARARRGWRLNQRPGAAPLHIGRLIAVPHGKRLDLR